jgi:hypothetical protein
MGGSFLDKKNKRLFQPRIELLLSYQGTRNKVFHKHHYMNELQGSAKELLTIEIYFFSLSRLLCSPPLEYARACVYNLSLPHAHKN